MHTDLEKLCASLDGLAGAVSTAWGTDVTMLEGVGWHSPALTRLDLAAVPKQLSHDLRAAAPSELDASLLALVQDFPRRLALVQAHTLPQMFGGNSPQAVPAFLATLNCLRQSLAPLIGWQLVTDSKSMPASIARRIRSLQFEVDQLVPKKNILQTQISDIERAHAAAESLPLDLQSLADARQILSEAVGEAQTNCAKTALSTVDAQEKADSLKLLQEQAEKTLALCEEAYRASTTKGLAAAFDDRASRLGMSMSAWIVGLVIALATGAWIGSRRVDILSSALALPDPRWGAIGMHILLSILSIGAPIWFAWLATKQIGQRFRLAEDYAFKASVVKAYEGYRKEAARIDPAFEARLFGSALTRLEEPPLRLVEAASHGSPWQELVGSEAFGKALSVVPELRDKFADLSRSALQAVSVKRPSIETAAAKSE